MLNHPLFPAVARSHRRKILAAPMMLLATGLLALGCLIVPTASAEPYCDGPSPPPICENPEPPAPPERLYLTATSWHGSVTTLENGPTESRYAASGNPIRLSAGSFGRADRVTITESWDCGWQGAGPGGSHTTTTAHHGYTVADFELRCQDGPETVPPEPSTRGLWLARVTAVAYDAHGVPTGELDIWVLGNQYPDDYREYLLNPWSWPPSPWS